MPGYKTHDTIGVITAVVTSGIATVISEVDIIKTAVYAITVVIATIWLSPDLDTDSMAYTRWGILRWYWYPYKKLVEHRSWLSHSGPLSGTLRLFYLFWPTLLVILWLPYSGFRVWELELWLLTWGPYIVIIWFGVVIADTVHTAADYISTGTKRLLRNY